MKMWKNSDIEVIERVIIHDMKVEEDEQMEEILEKDDPELETLFIAELENMTHSTMLEMEPRMKLPKVKLDNQTCHSRNKILALYLRDVDTVPEICDKGYAMGRAIASKMGVRVDKEQPGKKKGNAEGGNHRERKLKKEIKELRQKIAKTSKELYRRKQQRKATVKEKAILKELGTKIQKDMTSSNLRKVREVWLDQMRYKKVKLAKYTEKRRRKQDNIMFQRDQKGFFRTLDENGTREGEMPEMDKSVDFWGGIWERKERTPYMPWMEEIGRQLHQKVNSVNDFTVTFDKLKKEVAKRKGWRALGIDGIQNYWWKKFESAQKVLTKAFTKLKEDNSMIPIWWPTGRTVLLPKTRKLEDEKNYRPITCLNTSYKIMKGVTAKYI